MSANSQTVQTWTVSKYTDAYTGQRGWALWNTDEGYYMDFFTDRAEAVREAKAMNEAE